MNLKDASQPTGRVLCLAKPGSSEMASRTLGFTLAKGLIRALIRCPSPPSRILSTTSFWMYVEESMGCLSVDMLRALDLGQMGVVGWGQP